MMGGEGKSGTLKDISRSIVAVYPLDQIVSVEKLPPKKPSTD